LITAYVKRALYVNAMRQLHSSEPKVETDKPDDWEILKELDNKLGGNFEYKNSEEVWNEVREVAIDDSLELNTID
jgi:hypothetical protein